MDKEGRRKPIPEVKFVHTLSDFIKKTILTFVITKFLNYEKVIKLSVDKTDHLKSKGEQNDTNYYYYFENALKRALYRAKITLDPSKIVVLNQLHDQDIPHFEALLESLQNARDQVRDALNENNFQDALAYYFYYKENLKKFEESNSIRSEINILLADIHEAYANFLEEHEQTNIEDLIYNKIKAIIALSEALNGNKFEYATTPQTLYERIIEHTEYLSSTKVRNVRLDIAKVAEEKNTQIKNLFFPA